MLRQMIYFCCEVSCDRRISNKKKLKAGLILVMIDFESLDPVPNFCPLAQPHPIVHSQFPSLHIPANSRQSNTLNLDRHTLRQLKNSHTTSRRLMRKELLICSIHLSEGKHRREEHVNLDHLADIGAGGFEDCREVIDAELGHLSDG